MASPSITHDRTGSSIAAGVSGKRSGKSWPLRVSNIVAGKARSEEGAAPCAPGGGASLVTEIAHADRRCSDKVKSAGRRDRSGQVAHKRAHVGDRARHHHASGLGQRDRASLTDAVLAPLALVRPRANPLVDLSLTRPGALLAKLWRPRPELNRGKRFCRPLRNHSATWPCVTGRGRGR